ncbi:hypothetical protein T265_01667 [Opisthorchis viverrini]|uniref:Uncharacterized protein n=1 Tax=Opisthorchis viverrini TaxID=6198 RepID=A0A075A941_OPIVI|nr:hypothetical protein T265_01667 [Opisthorchis viverrini]KER32235.1 hypothetical protein T265_01667 [Opisthorchis viverrini]
MGGSRLHLLEELVFHYPVSLIDWGDAYADGTDYRLSQKVIGKVSGRAQTEEKAHVQRVTHPQGHHRFDTSGKEHRAIADPVEKSTGTNRELYTSEKPESMRASSVLRPEFLLALDYNEISGVSEHEKEWVNAGSTSTLHPFVCSTFKNTTLSRLGQPGSTPPPSSSGCYTPKGS